MSRYIDKDGKIAKVLSDKADINGDVWVEIDGQMPVKINWEEFLKEFNSILLQH
mgnify:CR=1 FL=1